MNESYEYMKLRETSVVAEATRRSMYGNRAADTKPELALRRALWTAGARGYRKNVKNLPGKPDIVYGRRKLAIFVNGCFWHGCPKCTRNRVPKTNSKYWSAKLQANRDRDVRNQSTLEGIGYRVLVLWECDLTPKLIGDAVEMILAQLTNPRFAPEE